MDDHLKYLYGLQRFGIAPGLAVMEQMMDALGHPEQRFRSVHVTGTNGKGSTCAMIASILRTAGYRTALYTSPHLYMFNERIQVGGVPISDDELTSLVKEIREVVIQCDIHPTFFEFTTALAFLFFARSNINIAVIEVGMGGAWDATNVIIPMLSVITNVGLDHMEFLGTTKQAIAQEKAGIIKEGVPVVTREEDPAILQIFEDVAQTKHTRVIRAQDVVDTKILSADLGGQKVEIGLIERTNPLQLPLRKGEGATPYSPPYEGGVRGGSSLYCIHLPLLGAHQVKNLETVLVAIPLLTKEGLGEVRREAISAGIAKVRWEGRMQVVSKSPLIIVDGAHNADGAHVLADFLQTIPSCDILIFAAKKRKDISDMLEYVMPRFRKIIVTQGEYMPEDSSVLAAQIRAVHQDVEIQNDVGQAVARGIELAGRNGVIVIAGSLYMIPRALSYIRQAL